MITKAITISLYLTLFAPLNLDNRILDMENHQEVPSKSIQKDGITFEWLFKDNRLHCRLMAPTSGWVAVGFNSMPGLKGTHLIMGAVDNDQIIISERFIVSHGNHQSIQSLGRSQDLLTHGWKENAAFTEFQFSIPVKNSDAWRKDLIEGHPYHILLAYSMADDFEHHSRVRRHVQVEL